MVQHYQICKLNTWNTRIFHEGNVKHRSMCHNQLMRFCLAPLGSALWLHQSWYPGGGGGVGGGVGGGCVVLKGKMNRNFFLEF